MGVANSGLWKTGAQIVNPRRRRLTTKPIEAYKVVVAYEVYTSNVHCNL